MRTHQQTDAGSSRSSLGETCDAEERYCLELCVATKQPGNVLLLERFVDVSPDEASFGGGNLAVHPKGEMWEFNCGNRNSLVSVGNGFRKDALLGEPVMMFKWIGAHLWLVNSYAVRNGLRIDNQTGMMLRM